MTNIFGKKKKKRKYQLYREWIGFTEPVGIFLFLLLMVGFVRVIQDIILQYQEQSEIWANTYTGLIYWSGYALAFMYCYSPAIKKSILYRYGVKYKAEIIKAKYRYTDNRFKNRETFCLEIDYIDSKGKKKKYYTPVYASSPNDYLKSAYCSVYEWMGFRVEGDFQLIEDTEHFERRTPPIPIEKANFIWR